MHISKLLSLGTIGALALSGGVVFGNIGPSANVAQAKSVSPASISAKTVKKATKPAPKKKTYFIKNSHISYDKNVVKGERKSVSFYYVQYGKNRRAYYQHYDRSKKRYVNIGSAVMKSPGSGLLGTGTINFKVPAGSTAFRIYIPATSKYTSLVKNLKVNITDPSKYTGYKKTAYNYAKRYCPVMRLTVKRSLPGGAIGMFYGSPNIHIKSGMSGLQLKHTMLHECAHMKEEKVYGGYIVNAYAPANKLFRTKGSMGVEKLADCMAQVAGGSARHSYYINGRQCSSYQKTKARQVWAGKKLY